MYIERIKIEQLGPITAATISPRLNTEGNPVPLILVGQNGAGKSLALSVILDAITEARRQAFTTLPEVGATDYLRLSSKNYINYSSAGYSHVEIGISAPDGPLVFHEIVSRIDFEKFQKIAPELAKLPEVSTGEFKTSGFHKHIAVQNPQKPAIQKLNFLYFPYFRYENAYWMSEAANVDFVK